MKSQRTLYGLLLVVGLPILTTGEENWPQYRGPHGSGQSTGSLPAEAWPDGGLPLIWRADTPHGFSSFSIAGGRAFTMVAKDVDGMQKEVCIAFDSSSGRQIWSVPFSECQYDHGGGNSGAQGNRGGDGPRSTPATDGKRVYVYDSQLNLACLDAKTGSLIWGYDIKKEFAGKPIYWRNAISPVLGKDTVYISGGGRGRSFLAFEKSTGKLRWQTGSDKVTHATPMLGEICGQSQLLHLVQTGLVSLDPATGSELWRAAFTFRTSTAASPVISDNFVYCSAAYGVGAALYEVAKIEDEYQVKEVWHKPNRLMNHWSTPIVYEGHLYGLFGFKKYGRGPLQCVEMRTGRVRWTEPGFGPGNLILVDDKLLVLADDGHLVLVEPSPTGYRELARMKAVTGKCWSTPAYSDGRVYIRSTMEGVCLNAAGN